MQKNKQREQQTNTVAVAEVVSYGIATAFSLGGMNCEGCIFI